MARRNRKKNVKFGDWFDWILRTGASQILRKMAPRTFPMVVSGPSGSGKSTLLEKYLSLPNL